ncbi:hypothetical protein LSAT2_006784 [Lamellibrachia satsuma]|nr:hypothetical protein LSAT2_006784 [Lamellibrachia satsuma]
MILSFGASHVPGIEIISRSRRQLVSIRMKVAVFFAAICIFALVVPQAYAEEEDEPAVREARGAKAPVMCAAKCQYNSCKKICMHCAICYCSNGINGIITIMKNAIFFAVICIFVLVMPQTDDDDEDDDNEVVHYYDYEDEDNCIFSLVILLFLLIVTIV